MGPDPLTPGAQTPTAPEAATSARPAPTTPPDEVQQVLRRLDELAREHELHQEHLTRLREERDSLILQGLAHGLSSTQLATTAHLTGARVRAIADAAAVSSARERVARAVSHLAQAQPAVCTTYGALATAIGIGSAKGVASSLTTNPEVSARESARVLLLRWASPVLGGYVIPEHEPAWQTQGDDTAARLECLKADQLVTRVSSPDGPAWVVPFHRVVADTPRLLQLIAG